MKLGKNIFGNCKYMDSNFEKVFEKSTELLMSAL